MKNISFITNIRTATLREIQDLSTDQLNAIPTGFNNNIIWNAGHLVASEQRMLYSRSGNAPLVSSEFFDKYQKGTRPNGHIDEEAIEEIKKLLIYSVEKFEKEYKNNFFTSYEPWTTSYGNTISSLDDAIVFLPFHEGLHLGCIKALKKLVQ